MERFPTMIDDLVRRLSPQGTPTQDEGMRDFVLRRLPGERPEQPVPLQAGAQNPAITSALRSLAPNIAAPMPPAPQPQGGGFQWEQLLKLLPLILAGMKGGMPAVGGYATGLAEGERQNQMLGMRLDEMAYGREQDDMQRQRQTAQDERQRREDQFREAERLRQRQRDTLEDLQGEAGAAVASAPMADEQVDDAPFPMTVTPEDRAFAQTQRAGQEMGADSAMIRRVGGQIPAAMSQRKRTAAVGVLKGLEGKDPASYQNQRFMDGLTVDQIKALAGDAGAGFGLPPSPDALKPPTNLEQALMRAKTPEEREAILGMMERASGARRAPDTSSEPLVAIMGPDGNPVMVPRAQAVGKRPANTREQGRPVQSNAAEGLAELQTSLDDVVVLRKALGTTGVESKLGAVAPNWVTEYTGYGAEAKVRQGVINRVKQVIGKALEGGVLRKEDEAKYKDILPTIGDPPDVAEAKINGLEAALKKKRQRVIEALEDAGYDVSKFNARGGAATTTAPKTKIRIVSVEEVK